MSHATLEAQSTASTSHATLSSPSTIIDPTTTIPIFITIPTGNAEPAAINVPAGVIVKPIIVALEDCTAADSKNTSHVCHRRPPTVTKSSGSNLKPGLWAVAMAGGFVWLLL